MKILIWKLRSTNTGHLWCVAKKWDQFGGNSYSYHPTQEAAMQYADKLTRGRA